MSDEEEDMSEGFSASEDEWKPGNNTRGGESSDDDDSDFEDGPVASSSGGNRAKKEAKPRSVSRGAVSKKRKPMGQSLRTKLYNKYRPPPKTFPSGGGNGGSNSPSASNSRTASKNARTPNESRDSGDDSSSESSVEDYLVNPADLDLRSSFFQTNENAKTTKEPSPAPFFDCNAGLKTLSDSGSESDDNETSHEHANSKAFDFRNLLEKANSLERAKETIAKRTADNKARTDVNAKTSSAAMDVNTLLALGEKNASFEGELQETQLAPSKLTKTKSTRVKRHTKTRPTSALVAAGVNDSDDSEFEEVADDDDGDTDSHNNTSKKSANDLNRIESLEIHVELPGAKKRTKQEKQQAELDLAFKRKLNHDIKKRQLLLHKASLLCCFARSYRYNKLLNDTQLMNAALKLLPSKNAYPPERGTEIKYFQSFITWFKTAVKLTSNNLYPTNVPRRKSQLREVLLEQIKRKEANCRQDFVFIFVILARGMGLQCRLVVNMQPLALKPSKSDLIPIKLKPDNDKDKKEDNKQSKSVKSEKSPAAKKEAKKSTKSEKEEELNSSQEQKQQKSSQKRKATTTNKKTKKSQQNSEAESSEGDSEAEFKEENIPPATRTMRKRPEKTTTNKMIEKDTKPEASAKDEDEETASSSRQTRTRSKTPKNEPSTTTITTSITAKAAKEKREEFAKSSKSSSSSDRPNIARLKRAKNTKLNTSEDEPQEKRTAINTSLNQSAFLGFTAEEQKSGSSSKTLASKLSRITVQKPNESAQEKENMPTTTAKEEKPKRTNGKSPKITVTTVQTKNAVGISTRRSLRTRSTSPKIKVDPSFLRPKSQERDEDKEREENSKAKVVTRERSKSPKIKVDPTFLKRKNSAVSAEAESTEDEVQAKPRGRPKKSNNAAAPSPPTNKDLNGNLETKPKRALRTRQTTTPTNAKSPATLQIPQLDGADDLSESDLAPSSSKSSKSKLSKSKKLNISRSRDSEEEFEPSPPKRPKPAPVLPKAVQQLRKDRRVISTDDEDKKEKKSDGADFWVEIWSDVEEQWISIDLVKGKVHSVEAIRKAASTSLAYVFAFQNDLSLKDVTARYCPHWTVTVRKERVDKAWLDHAIAPYIGRRTKRDIREDQELRRIHEEKPLPTAIGDFKDHPLYALERHLLKFQALYPPDAPTLGFIRGEPIYARECVHTLHSREIWLKAARTVKLGEQPYKIVKARPKWDRLTQSVIKDQPLEIFGYWQTQDYEPPTAENGLVPRNAYGNVELFKECMLPKGTVHLRLNGLNRICRKLGVDCANAVIGFDFHQGACHPTYDGFIICEEFQDQVVAAWHQDQEDQVRKDQEKYEARVYGNWKKLIRGLLIRERLKKKYNF